MEKLKNNKIGFFSYVSSVSPTESPDTTVNKIPKSGRLSLELHEVEMTENASPRINIDNAINIFINQR